MRIAAALALALACAGAVAAPTLGAAPSAYQAVLRVYEQHGTVAACQFSPAQLQSALKGVDSYGAQYFADFTQAIQNALTIRASGSCSAGAGLSGSAAGSAGSAGPAGPAGPVGAVGPPAHFGPVTAATSAGVPAPLALMGVLAAAAALCGAGAAAVRTRGKRGARPPGDAEPPP
jgi:hypothetical protein